MLLAGIAEFERELIRERTGDGRKRAMAAGVKFSRKPKLSEYQRAEAMKRRANGETLAAIAIFRCFPPHPRRLGPLWPSGHRISRTPQLPKIHSPRKIQR
jgi:hypothetical protein